MKKKVSLLKVHQCRLDICESRNGESGNGMREIRVGTRGIKVRMWGVRVATRGIEWNRNRKKRKVHKIQFSKHEASLPGSQCRQ